MAWLIAFLLAAGVAWADDMTSGGSNSSDDGVNDLPPAGLTGWFFTSANPPAYPVETDPGEPWTSPENIATLDCWLSLVAELQYDPALLQELYGLGMISAPDAAAIVAAETAVSDMLQSDLNLDQPAPGGVPEPATALMLGGVLVLLGLFTATCKRRVDGVLSRPPERHTLVWKHGSL